MVIDILDVYFKNTTYLWRLHAHLPLKDVCKPSIAILKTIE